MSTNCLKSTSRATGLVSHLRVGAMKRHGCHSSSTVQHIGNCPLNCHFTLNKQHKRQICFEVSNTHFVVAAFFFVFYCFGSCDEEATRHAQDFARDYCNSLRHSHSLSVWARACAVQTSR